MHRNGPVVSMDSLESRTLLAATPVPVAPAPVLNETGLLYIKGTDSADFVSITIDARRKSKLNVLINQTVYKFDKAAVKQIKLKMCGGNDQVWFEFDQGKVFNPALVLGGDGNDTLTGGAGNDTIDGSAGRDSLYGNDGNDYLTGCDGSDTLEGAAGKDSLFGGNDDDTLIDDVSTSLLDGGAGRDRINKVLEPAPVASPMIATNPVLTSDARLW